MGCGLYMVCSVWVWAAARPGGLMGGPSSVTAL